MNFLFRRSASIAAASARKRTLIAALLSSDVLGLPQALPSEHPFSPATGVFHAAAHFLEKRGLVGVPRRDIHSSAGPLGLRATDAAPAGYAVANFYNDERTPPTTAVVNEADEGLEIAKLGISPQIVDQLANKGITKLFPVQRAVLEPAMQGRDMIGRAKTGTGKTLAFGIPIMDKILRFNAKHGRGRNPLALVLAPTRELARQVEKEFRESAPLDTICVYGGTPIQQQMRALEYGVDVVVGTPGRVIDLLNRGTLVLSQVQFIVLDEADQMLAVGFAEDVEKILEKLPLQRQSMMFSATMPPSIRELTGKYLKDPLTIDLVGENDQKLAEGITLYSIASENYAKPSILGTLIKEHAKGGKCIVFTQTKRDADQLAYTLGRTLGCEPLHGDISQNQRERTLAGFRDGRFNILIATDVAARGLDIPNVDLVIHYELPNTSELFVHRSGRTARAGKKGSAILIYTQEQSRLVRGIEQDIACRFTELPSITVEGGGMLGGMGGQRDYFGGGRMSGQGFGRAGSGGYRGSNYGGGSGGYRGSNFGFGNPGRAAVDVESMPDRFRSGSGLTGGSFGSSGFGHPGRPRESGPGRFGSSSESGTGWFGSSPDLGTGRFGSFGNSGPARANIFGGGGSGQEGTDNSWPGRSFMSSS